MFHSPVVGLSSGQRMGDDHYDIPWEFKNRALAAVVGQQLQQQHKKQRGETTTAAEVPTERGDSEMDRLQQQQQQIVRKRLSLPQAMCNNALGKKLMGNGTGRARERTMAQGTVPANEQFQFIQQPTTATPFLSPQMASLPSAPLVPPSSSSSSPSSSSASAESVSAAISRRNAPPPSHRRGVATTHPPQQKQPYAPHQSHRSPRKAIAADQRTRPSEQTTEGGTSSGVAQLRNYPMVAMPTSATAKEVIAFCQRRQCPPALEDFDSLVHEKMNRCQSEQILCPMNLGAHLLRRRPDRNLALSLRAKEGVLHIKLEFHQGQWVLGDGPRFSSVHGMLRAYRRTELPVRGAEQIRLGVLLKPTDVRGGLLLL